MRLIDKMALCDELIRWRNSRIDDAIDAEYNAILKALEIVGSAPTVDAVPVVHGHWEIVPNDKNKDGYYKMRCSACGATLWSIEPEELYCCKCGAKMDGADGERSENGEVR